MSTYDIVCQTYEVVRVLEGLSQLFQRNQIPCPQQRQMGCAFPTTRSSFLASQQARQCQKHCFCGVLAPSKRAMVVFYRHCLQTSQLCRPPLGLSESLAVPILEPQDSFSLLPKGLEEGVLHVQWWHIPNETRGGCVLHGPLREQILLEWAGMGSQRWSVHKNVLAQIHIVVWVMAGGRCCTCFQSTIGVTS
jgi:hypothetical protein